MNCYPARTPSAMSHRMSVFVSVLFVLIIALHSCHCYECSSENPHSGQAQCDSDVCAVCATTCVGYDGWDAVCQIDGGMVTETCTCRKSRYICTDDKPTTGVPQCDAVCQSCQQSCVGYVGWRAECDLQGGLVTETCNCQNMKKTLFPVNTLSKVVKVQKQKV